MNRREDLNRFYDLMHRLEERIGGCRYLGDADASRGLPQRGIYFFYEPGEYREDGKTPRVTRVGTHAVSEGSRTTLWNRLAQHRGNLRGRHAGGGNHRGSIFRLHVGTALLSRGMGQAAAAISWGRSEKPPEELAREAEFRLEQLVSRYIRALPFLWLEVDDPPSKTSDRKVIETNAIALLSNKGKAPIDVPSADWMGRWADRAAVPESGLWNVNHVDEPYDPAFLDMLEHYVGK